MPDSPDRGELPRFASITVIDLRHWWQVGAAARRWRRLFRELRAAGYRLDSRSVPSRRTRSITFLTLAWDEEELRDAAATLSHVTAVRWTIPRRTGLWSAVFTVAGWSSMSGPARGNWSARSAARALAAKTPQQHDDPE